MFRKLSMKLVFASSAVLAVTLLSPVNAQAFDEDFGWEDWYYSDSSYSTVVGKFGCYRDWGVHTDYVLTHHTPGCIP